MKRTLLSSVMYRHMAINRSTTLTHMGKVIAHNINININLFVYDKLYDQSIDIYHEIEYYGSIPYDMNTGLKRDDTLNELRNIVSSYINCEMADNGDGLVLYNPI